jgi:hypothetical protein
VETSSGSAMPKFFLFRWTVGTVVGWIAGLLLAYIIGNSLVSRASFQTTFGYTDEFWSLMLLIGGVTIGIFLGFAQWIVALRKLVYGPVWISATTAMAILFYAVSRFLLAQSWMPSISVVNQFQCLSASCTVYKLTDTWFIGFLTVVLASGICLAIPLWAVFHSYNRALFWSLCAGLATAAGVSITYVAWVLIVTVTAGVDFSFYLFFGPAVFTIILGIFVVRILKNPKKGDIRGEFDGTA